MRPRRPAASVRASERPGVEDERVVPAVQEDDVEDVERADRDHPGDQRAFAMPVQRLEGEAAGIDLAAVGHDLLDAVVEVEVPGEGLVAELGKAALDAEGHARAVEQNRGLEPLLDEAGGLEEIDETDRAFEGDG